MKSPLRMRSVFLAAREITKNDSHNSLCIAVCNRRDPDGTNVSPRTQYVRQHRNPALLICLTDNCLAELWLVGRTRNRPKRWK